MDCWAKSLGDCGGGISREHIVSKALFSDSVSIRGLPWCRNEVKSIGVNSAVVRNACRDHNSRMSPRDAAALRFKQQIEEMIRRVEGPNQDPIPTHRRRTLCVDEIERWLLKTVVNVLCATDETGFRLGSASEPGVVPDEIVGRVFLNRPLPRKLGGYVAALRGTRFVANTVVKVLDLELIESTYAPGAIVGARTKFVGVEFALWLDDRSPPPFSNTIRDGVITMSHGNSNYEIECSY